ncbi:hypothetical protein [Gordonia sp. (in: high G+C Gram-positive bacteria)]|uniref:hypothetical protein n=1 Tax=Gordonia sp. (in: high G+C Gram-positive bacteria) TaxID=84139 RepID=UPI003529D117
MTTPAAPTAATTELGVRSLIRVADNPGFTAAVHQQLYSWCKNKQWDADRITGPGAFDVAKGVSASLVRDERQDGSLIERYRFHQDQGSGLWITHLTTYADRDGGGWVWTDVFKPAEGGDARVPNLARNILEVVPGLDGRHRLTAQPFMARSDDVDEIYEALVDEQRRGFLFLAGADDNTVIPQSQWAKYITRLLAGTTGLASAYVLDGAATRLLNSRLPESHHVRPWTIRTFHPLPRLSDPQDAIRHRVLSTERIINDREARLRNVLANAACRHSTTIALPRDLVRIDRFLRRLLDSVIVDQQTLLPITSGTSSEAVDSDPSAAPAAEPAGPADTSQEAGTREKVWATLSTTLATVTGRATVTIEAVRHLGQLATEAQTLQRASVSLSRLRRRLDSVQAERDALEDQTTELTQQVKDTKEEFTLARIDLADAQAKVRELSRELAKVQTTEVQWAPEPDPIDTPPLSFEELIGRIDEFGHLEFTGSEKPALDLDKHDSTDWAIATWGYLRVLDEYCEQRSAEAFDGSVGDYISTRPKGHASIPPGSYAPDETTDLFNNRKLRRMREFPVPVEVDPRGERFMGEHVRIAAYKTISPRMHILNCAAKHGRIYIGYIGKHLENSRTN